MTCVLRAILVVLLVAAACGYPPLPAVVPDAGPRCGNSRLDFEEECDPSIAGTAGCTPDCKVQPWPKVATLTDLQLDPDRFGYLAVGLGSKIFFGPETNTVANSYWRSVDVSTGELSPPLALPDEPHDFCACGFGQVLVATPTSIFMFGNNGARYTPSLGTWSPVSSYENEFQRGESAGAYDASDDAILMVGGRGPLDTASRYDLTTNMFVAESGILPFGVDHAVAYTPAGDNRTYVAGGVASDGSLRHLVVHTTGSATWTRLADAPDDLGFEPSGIGETTSTDGTRRLFVSNHAAVHFFNIAANTWDRQLPLPINALSGDANARTIMVNGVAYAMVQEGASAAVYRMPPIE
jgi:hypothetical protein